MRQRRSRPRADIYALGMVLREALTGTRPRPGDEREATLAAARKGELVPWPAGFESPLVAIVDRATALDRRERYADARAMLEELDAFIVSERAAKKSDSPTRRLAAWLADVWKEARDEDAIDEAIEGSHLVSFLDDGALDVVGTGTEHSMAATADAEPVAIPAPVSDPVVTTAKPEPTPEPAKKRPALVPLLIVGALGVGIAYVAIPSGTPIAPPPMPPPLHISLPLDAAAMAAVADAPVIVAVVDDAAIPAITPDAGVVKRPHVVIDAGSRVAPVAATHTVLVNAKRGWAYFTIDSDATQYQTLANVKLSVGAHTLHFTQGEAKKDISITVPDNDELRVIADLAPM